MELITHQKMWDALKERFKEEQSKQGHSPEFRSFCEWAQRVMLGFEYGFVEQQASADENYPKTLEQYLKENHEVHHIDHAIRSSVIQEGDVSFYIHANGHDSDTLDFYVWGNDLIPRGVANMNNK